MNPQFNTCQRLIVAAGLLLGGWIAHPATAKTIVDWGGDYVTGSRDLVLPAGVDNGGTRTYPYSATVPITPGSSLYLAPEGKSGTFYGASELTSTDGTPRNFGAARVSNNGTNDWIYFQGVSQVGGSLQGLVFFSKAHFLNGFNTPTIPLDHLSGRVLIASLADSGLFRFAVRDGDNQWYLSQSSRTTPGSFVLASLAEESWGAWDPSGAPIASPPSSFAVAGTALADITGFGYYFYAARGASAPGTNVEAFQIDFVPQAATVIAIK